MLGVLISIQNHHANYGDTILHQLLPWSGKCVIMGRLCSHEETAEGKDKRKQSEPLRFVTTHTKTWNNKVKRCKQSTVVGTYFRQPINWKTHTHMYTLVCVISPDCGKCITFLKQILFCFLASVMLPHSDSLSIPEVSFVVNPEMFPGRPLLNARTQACVTFGAAMFVVLYGHQHSVRIFYRKEKYKCFPFVDDESLLFAVAHYCTLWIMFTWMPSKFVPLQPCLKCHCNAKAGFL